MGTKLLIFTERPPAETCPSPELPRVSHCGHTRHTRSHPFLSHKLRVTAAVRRLPLVAMTDISGRSHTCLSSCGMRLIDRSIIPATMVYDIFLPTRVPGDLVFNTRLYRHLKNYLSINIFENIVCFTLLQVVII